MDNFQKELLCALGEIKDAILGRQAQRRHKDAVDVLMEMCNAHKDERPLYEDLYSRFSGERRGNN